MIDPLSILSDLAAMDLGFLKQPPASTLFILVLSAAISLATSVANRMVVDMDEQKRRTVESHHLRQELMAATRSGNQRRIAKAQKRQQQMMKTQQKMTMDRMKIMLLFFIPLILIWQVLRKFLGGVEYIALMPFKVPWIAPEGTLSFASWYILCSISINIVIQRVLGFTFEIEPREG